MVAIKVCGFVLGEHLKEDFGAINPFRLVPAIDDNGFKLSERLFSVHNFLARK